MQSLFSRYSTGVVFIPFVLVHVYALLYFKEELLPGHWKLYGIHWLSVIVPILYLFFERNTGINKALYDEIANVWGLLKSEWKSIMPVLVVLLSAYVFMIENSLLAQSERGMWFVEQHVVPLIHVPIDNVFQLRLNFFLDQWGPFDYAQFVSSFGLSVLFLIFLLYSRGSSVRLAWLIVLILALGNFIVIKENLYCHTKINTAIFAVIAYYFAAKSKYGLAFFMISWSCIIGLAGVIYTIPLVLMYGVELFRRQEHFTWGGIYVLLSAGVVSFFSIWGTFYYVLKTRGGPEYLVDNVEAGSNMFWFSTASHLLNDLSGRFPVLFILAAMGFLISILIERVWLRKFIILFVGWFMIRSTIDLSGFYYSLELIPFLAFLAYHGLSKCSEFPYFSKNACSRVILVAILLPLASWQCYGSYIEWERTYLSNQNSSLKSLLENNSWLPEGTMVFYRGAVLSPYFKRYGRGDLRYQSYPGKKPLFLETVAKEDNALIFGPSNDFGIRDEDLRELGYAKVPGFYDKSQRWRMFYKVRQ